MAVRARSKQAGPIKKALRQGVDVNRLRRHAKRVRDIEAACMAAEAAGDGDRAARLVGDLVGAEHALRRQIAIEDAQAKLRAQIPGDDMAGGVPRFVVHVPGVNAATGREEIRSVECGARGRAIWAIDMAPALKYTAARYAALREAIQVGVSISVVDHSAIRVDGGGAEIERPLRMLDMIDDIARANAELERVEPMAPKRWRKGDRRCVISAKAMAEGVIVQDQPLSTTMSAYGWPWHDYARVMARQLLISAIEAIQMGWRRGPVTGADACGKIVAKNLGDVCSGRERGLDEAGRQRKPLDTKGGLR